MKSRFALLLLGLAFLTSCGRTVYDSSLYCNSGRTKPIVAVLPVIDSTDQSTCWDLSEEFTAEIQNRIYNSPKLYLLRQEIPLHVAQSLNKPEIKQLSSDVMDSLGAAEFVIVTELLDQQERAYNAKKAGSEVGGLFSIAMRVRIFDIRGNTPKVILQEVIDHDHVIPRHYMDCDYQKMAWGVTGFELTPMGMAHKKLIKELIAHAEGYIGVSKG